MPVPSRPATARIVTASRPSASAIATAAWTTCCRVCRGCGPLRRTAPGSARTAPGSARTAPGSARTAPGSARAADAAAPGSARAAASSRFAFTPTAPSCPLATTTCHNLISYLIRRTKYDKRRASVIAIEATGLRKSFGKVKALDGLDLTVPAGRVCALLGPNGAGKTTAVRILATLARPDAGTARVAGHDPVSEPRRVRELVGLAGQHAAVDDEPTGRGNPFILGLMHHLGRRGARIRASELLEQFGLAEAADRLVKTWSGGMRRRLDVVASLIVTPLVLFLDEPTTGLDPRSRAEIWTAIRNLASPGTTILLTTQYLDEADQLSDQIVIIDAGRVVAQGRPDDLKDTLGS